MEEGTINRVSKDVSRAVNTPEIESTYKVEPVGETETKKADGTGENPNETPKNLHPYLGHNLDIKA